MEAEQWVSERLNRERVLNLADERVSNAVLAQEDVSLKRENSGERLAKMHDFAPQPQPHRHIEYSSACACPTG